MVMASRAYDEQDDQGVLLLYSDVGEDGLHHQRYVVLVLVPQLLHALVVRT